MKNIMLALRQIAETHEDVELVYPVHLSPGAGGSAGISGWGARSAFD